MRITYACPACHETTTLANIERLDALECGSCHALLPIPAGGLSGGDSGTARLERCLVCPSLDLFVRKDFPQRLGVAIVAAGLAASCVAWANRELLATFGILFGTALVDVVLYFLMPDCLTCYRCNARYHGDGVTSGTDQADGGGRFGGFDLETHEKHRQHAARAAQIAAGTDPLPR